CAGGKLIGSVEDGICDFTGAASGVFRDDMLHAAAAKLLVLGVAGVDNAVTEEDEHVTGFSVNRDFVIRDIFKHAQWKAGRLQHVGVPVAAINGAGKPGVGHTHGLLLVVPERA